MTMAEPSKPTGDPPAVNPGKLPAPDEIRPMPDDVMNWERKSLNGEPSPRAGQSASSERHP
jgi:hypothetical protein